MQLIKQRLLQGTTLLIAALGAIGCVAGTNEEGVDESAGELGEKDLAVTVNTGSTMTIKGVQSGNCLGLKGNATASGTLVQMQGCSGSSFQNWTATRDSAGYYQLKNVGSGLCLDVKANSTTAGTDIQVWGCAGSDNQKWNLGDQGNSVFAVVSKSSGLALDVYGASTANGARVVQYTWAGSANQKFTLPGASLSGGTTTTTPASGVTGFAATSSSGLSTTTGGGSATVETVTTCAALKSKLEDSTARVLQIPSGTTLDCRTAARTISVCELKCTSTGSQVYWRAPVTGQNCTTLADTNGDGTLDVPAGKYVNKTAYDFRINVNSNKTLRGAGSGATIKGASFNITGKSNIIARNIAITDINPSIIEAGDAFTINGSHHVWVDHVKFSLISDGYADIREGSSAVTMSYNQIDGANPYVCGGQHNFISLVTDSQVTYHHNYFNHVGGRNPKVDGASKVHIYNNYYDSVSYFCANSGTGSQVLVQNNYYYNSRYPHWAAGGLIEASGNYYAGTTSTAARDNNGNVFDAPYSYSLDAVGGLNSSVPAKAGIGKL